MTIRDLPNPHFLLLSPQERFDLVRDLRTARRVETKRSAARRSSITGTRKTAATSVANALAGLSPDQAKLLLESLT